MTIGGSFMLKLKWSNSSLIILTILITISIIGVRFLINTWKPIKQANTVLLSISDPGGKPEKDILSLDSGPALGRKIPVLDGVKTNGIKTNLSLDTSKKPKLLFSMPDLHECHKCIAAAYEGIEEFSTQLEDQAEIYLLYPDKADYEGFTLRSRKKNVNLVEETTSFNLKLKSLRPRLFFITKDGVIKYFINFPQALYEWTDDCKNAVRFVQTGIIPNSDNQLLGKNVN